MVPLIVHIVLIGHELDEDGMVFQLWLKRHGGRWNEWNFENILYG
jgi:hypothetical protein